MFKDISVTLMLLMGMVVLGCDANSNGPVPGPGGEGPFNVTGMELSVDIIEDTDATAMRFLVNRVACPGEGDFEEADYEAIEDLKDSCLPTGLDAFANDPLDEGSCHRFADHYFVLPEGCYAVETRPLSGSSLSGDCEPAAMDDVVVVDGETTEILLVNQCQGPPVGGLDVISVINRPPTLVNLNFFPSKFIDDCRGTVVCATAFDPNGDPLEFVWQRVSGPDLLTDPVVFSRSVNQGRVTECARFFPGEAGAYEIQVTVYDLVWEDGQLIRVEDWLELEGYPNESHDDLIFPIYSSEDCEDDDLSPIE